MTLSHLPLAAGLALAQIGAASSIAGAQGTIDVRPTLRVTELYESNLFAAADGTTPRQEDVITRVSPGVESEYRTPRLTASASYTLDLERFAKHHDLTSAGARQHALAALTYQTTPRVSVNGGVEFVTTRTPHELNVLSGLAFDRIRGSRLSAHSTVRRELDPVTTGTLEYRFSRDWAGRGFEAYTHAAAIGAERRVSRRTTITGWYRADRFAFTTTVIDGWAVLSHSATFGVTHDITSRVSASVEAGPRVVENAVRPDLAASVDWDLPRADLSLVYGQSQTTVFGAVGAVDVQSLRLSLVRTVGRSLELRLTPAVFTSALRGRRADVYVMTAGLVHRISNELGLELSVDSAVQRGNLFGAAGGETIPRHTAVIRFVAAPAADRRR